MNGYPAFENLHVLKTGGGSQGTISGSTVNQMTNEDKTLRRAILRLRPPHRWIFRRRFLTTRVGRPQAGDRSLRGELEVLLAGRAGPHRGTGGVLVQRGTRQWHRLSKNSTDAVDLSLRVSSADGDFSWQAVAWHQQREFDSVFSSVNPDRSAETVALNQFDVPAEATGASFTTLWDDIGKWTVSSGCGRQSRLRRNQRNRRHLPNTRSRRRPGTGGYFHCGLLSGG